MYDEARLTHIKNVINVDDMAEIIEYLHNERGWSYYNAYLSCKLYKNYLYLLAKYKKNIPPSFEIYQVWRAHALIEPEDYRKMCHEIFGDESARLSRVKHYFKDDEFISPIDRDNFENITADLYFKEFGKKINVFYARHWKEILLEKMGEYKSTILKIVSTVVVPLTIYLWVSSVGHYNDLIREAHADITKAMISVSQKFEDRNIICRFSLKDQQNHNYITMLYDYHQSLTNELVKLISIVDQTYANNLITPKLRLNLLSFAKKYDHILSQEGPYICRIKMEDPEAERQARGEQIKAIKESESSLETSILGIKIKDKHDISYTPEGFGIH